MEGKQKIMYMVTKSNWGGAQRYVYDLATHLSSKGFEVVVVLGGTGPLYERLKERGIRTISLEKLHYDVPMLKDTWSMINPIRVIRSLIRELQVLVALIRLLQSERPHILHINSSKIGGLGACAGRLARVPRIIFTAHGWAFNESRSKAVREVIRFLHWMTVLLAHHTILVSEALAAPMIALPGCKNRMRVIHLGIITPDTLLQKDMARDALTQRAPALQQIQKNATWMVTIGELIHTKGIDVALRAAKEISKIETFVWCFIGDGADRARFEKLRDSLGLTHQCIFLGHIKDAATYLPAFDVVVLPSRSEAFGYVLLEAGIARVPIIAAHVGGIPEILQEDAPCGILFPKEDSTALAHAITHLCHATHARHMMSSAFAERVATAFSFESMIKQTIAVYTNGR